MKYPRGGHVINWIKDGNSYYVFDMVNLVGNGYQQHGFLFTSGATLKEAISAWSEKSPNQKQMIFVYQSFDGDVPVGWNPNDNLTRLPDRFKDAVTIILETPEEGYVHEWATMDEDTWAKIERLRTTPQS